MYSWCFYFYAHVKVIYNGLNTCFPFVCILFYNKAKCFIKWLSDPLSTKGPCLKGCLCCSPKRHSLTQKSLTLLYSSVPHWPDCNIASCKNCTKWEAEAEFGVFQTIPRQKPAFPWLHSIPGNRCRAWVMPEYRQWDNWGGSVISGRGNNNLYIFTLLSGAVMERILVSSCVRNYC